MIGLAGSPARLPAALALVAGFSAVLAASRAEADATALRAPAIGRSISFELGYPSTSLGVWINDWLGVGVFAGVPLTSAGAELGLRKTFAGDARRGWGLDGLAMFGLEFPTLAPALVLDATGCLRLRFFGDYFNAALAATVPASFRVTDELQAKLPAQLDVWIGGHAGGVWAALHGGVGVTFLPPYTPSPALHLGVVIGLEL